MLGLLTRSAGREPQAIAYYNRALDLANRALPRDPPALGCLLVQVGRANQWSNTERGYAEAEACYQRAAPILKATYGPNNVQLADLFAAWSLLRVAHADIVGAIELRARSNEIEDKYLSYVLASGDEAERRDDARTPARDPGEGVHGLRRALAVAGAETQVMTLWKVDDQATRNLMIRYHDELLRRGTGRAEALLRSPRALASRPATRQPYFWASRGARGARGCACDVSSPGIPPGLPCVGAAFLALGWRACRTIGR
jgi:tetratricopeptide (TPR) repeat protein